MNVYKKFRNLIERHGFKLEKYDHVVAAPGFTAPATLYFVVDPSDNNHKITKIFEPIAPFKEKDLENVIEKIERYISDKNFNNKDVFMKWLSEEATHKGNY